MSNNCSCDNKYNSPIYPSSNVLGLAITSGLTPGRALIDNLTVAAKIYLVKPEIPTFSQGVAVVAGQEPINPLVNRVLVSQKNVAGYQTVSSVGIIQGGAGYIDAKNVAVVVSNVSNDAVIKTFLSPGTDQMPKYRTKVGQGLTVDITTSLGEITGVEIKNPGFGYEAGSVVKVLGGTSGNLATLVVGLGPWVKAGQQVSQNPRVVVENISLSTGDKGGPVYNYANMRGAIISTQWNVIGASHLEVPGKTTTSGVITTKIVRPKEGDVSTANSEAFEVETRQRMKKNEVVNSYAPCVINVERGVTGYKRGKRVPATYADPSGGVKNRPEKVTGSAASFIVLEGGAGYDNKKLYMAVAFAETFAGELYHSQGNLFEIRTSTVGGVLRGGIITNPGKNYRVGDQLSISIPVSEKSQSITPTGSPIYVTPATPTTLAKIQITGLVRDCVNQTQRIISTKNVLYATFASNYVL